MVTTLGSGDAERATHRRTSATDRRVPWRLWLPDGLDTGVHAETVRNDSGLLHVGENWTTPALSIDPHEHPGWEIYLQLHGTSRWLIGNRPVALGPGWAVAVPPGLRHGHDPRVGRAPRHHYAYAAFDADVVGVRAPALAATWRTATTLVAPDGWSLQPAFRLLVREVLHERPLGEHGLRAALDLLLVASARVLHGMGEGTARAPGHPAVLRAKALLDEDLARPWTGDALATAVGLSRAHLAELFAAEVGQPPYSYLLERRIERAADLLEATRRDVGEIAADVGFSSGSALARAFRSVRGCSPAQWRRTSQS